MDAVRRLLAFPGILVDRPNEAGETALMHAAACGELGVCRELLRHGADGKAVDANGASATHWALRSRGGWGNMLGLIGVSIGTAALSGAGGAAAAATAAAGNQNEQQQQQSHQRQQRKS